LPVKITVVTPSYNQVRFLDETLRSVLSQRDQIHEYFVLDGGSTDGSAELIRRCAEERGGIDYWHSRKDRGQSDAIHQGFARATGDYVAWLNSDDVFLPGALKRVREALEAHGDWDALTGYYVHADADSRVLAAYRIPRESGLMARWGVVHVPQQTCFFRKSLYDRVGGLDLDLHCRMDTDLWCRMFAAGARWGHVPEYLAAFRVHGDAKGSSWVTRYAEEARTVESRHPQYTVTPRRHAGLAFYRAAQVLSGRQVRAGIDTRRYRGRRLADVFGEWPMATLATPQDRAANAGAAPTRGVHEPTVAG
jgi:glycosyltransferase involved in cell wall biosynthesis